MCVRCEKRKGIEKHLLMFWSARIIDFDSKNWIPIDFSCYSVNKIQKFRLTTWIDEQWHLPLKWLSGNEWINKKKRANIRYVYQTFRYESGQHAGTYRVQFFFCRFHGICKNRIIFKMNYLLFEQIDIMQEYIS